MKNNKSIKEIDIIFIFSLQDGSIGLLFFEDRRDFPKRNNLHFVMSKSNDRNMLLFEKKMH